MRENRGRVIIKKEKKRDLVLGCQDFIPAQTPLAFESRVMSHKKLENAGILALRNVML